jgi:hypothetical protein
MPNKLSIAASLLLFGSTTSAQDVSGCHKMVDAGRTRDEYHSFNKDTCNSNTFLRKDRDPPQLNEWTFIDVPGKANTYYIQANRKDAKCTDRYLTSEKVKACTNRNVKMTDKMDEATEWEVNPKGNGVTITNAGRRDASCKFQHLIGFGNAFGEPRMEDNLNSPQAVWNLDQCYTHPSPVDPQISSCITLKNENKIGAQWLSSHNNCGIRTNMKDDTEAHDWTHEWDFVPVDGEDVDVFYIKARGQRDNCDKNYLAVAKQCNSDMTIMQKGVGEEGLEKWKVVREGETHKIMNVGRLNSFCFKDTLSAKVHKHGWPILVDELDEDDTNKEWRLDQCVREEALAVDLPGCGRFINQGRVDTDKQSEVMVSKGGCANRAHIRDWDAG